MNDTTEMMKEKFLFYKGKPIEVHITKKRKSEFHKPEWYNCYIIGEEDGTFIAKERKIGIIRIFPSEIFSVEEVVQVKRSKGDVD